MVAISYISRDHYEVLTIKFSAWIASRRTSPVGAINTRFLPVTEVELVKAGTSSGRAGEAARVCHSDLPNNFFFQFNLMSIEFA
jgi:hypothetical protein